MEASLIRDKVVEELNLIPDHKLVAVYDFIHDFRLGLENSKGNAERIMKFAGCWQDMSAERFHEFLAEITQRREQAFSRRRAHEASAG